MKHLVAKKIPAKLERDPIVEALFEIRFQASVPDVSTLLPGLMFSSMREDFEAPERLPTFNFPSIALDADPNLKYQPSFRIKSKNFVVLLGDYSLIISCPRPYVGWDKFREIILKLLSALEGTKLVSDVERISVKYLNLLTAESSQKQFQLLKLTSNLGDYDLTAHQTSIQSEIIDENLTNLIEVRANVQLGYPDGKTDTGILVSVDTICFKHENFWSKTKEYVDKVHNKEKQIFYSLLTEEAVNGCGPVWE